MITIDQVQGTIRFLRGLQRNEHTHVDSQIRDLYDLIGRLRSEENGNYERST